MENDVLYCALVLDKESSSTLMEMAQLIIPQIWPKANIQYQCHHTTLVFKPAPDDAILSWAKQNEGQEFPIAVTSCGYSDKALAVGISVKAPSANRIKHITLAVNKSNGGKPVDSNSIQDWTDISDKMISLTGLVTIFYGY